MFTTGSSVFWAPNEKVRTCQADVYFPPSPSVEAGTPVIGNDEFENNLVLVERVAYSRGLPPEAISVMLEFAMSLRMGKTVLTTWVFCD